jgi:hypothetical protein
MTITYIVRIKSPPEHDITLIDNAEAAVRLTDDCSSPKHAEAVATLMQVAGLSVANIMAAFERWIGEHQTATEAHQLLRDMWGEAPEWLQQELASRVRT